MQSLAKLQTQMNAMLGPLLLIDFAQLMLMTCALAILPFKYLNYVELNVATGLAFFGNFICFLLRFVTLIICMGKVYPTGLAVNSAVARALVSAKDSSECQSVVAYLTAYATNPICFTAWDFFPITRGTLLAALSAITTYGVLLLQID